MYGLTYGIPIRVRDCASATRIDVCLERSRYLFHLCFGSTAHGRDEPPELTAKYGRRWNTRREVRLEKWIWPLLFQRVIVREWVERRCIRLRMQNH